MILFEEVDDDMDLNWKHLLDGKPQNKIEMSLITTGWWFEPL